jgi:hypothetical protein
MTDDSEASKSKLSAAGAKTKQVTTGLVNSTSVTAGTAAAIHPDVGLLLVLVLAPHLPSLIEFAKWYMRHRQQVLRLRECRERRREIFPKLLDKAEGPDLWDLLDMYGVDPDHLSGQRDFQPDRRPSIDEEDEPGSRDGTGNSAIPPAPSCD